MQRALFAALARRGEAALHQQQQQQQPAALCAAAAAALRPFSTDGGGAADQQQHQQQQQQESRQSSWLYDASLLPPQSSSNDSSKGPPRPPRLSSLAGATSNGAPAPRRRASRAAPAATPKLPLLEALRALRDARAAQLSGSPSQKERPHETVEMHVRLRGVDPRRGDHSVRGAALLPHAVGRPPRVAVFAEPGTPAADAASAAGADLVGGEALIDAIVETKGRNFADIDRCVAHPDLARALARAGRVLGPRGLMPNPKVGTLTSDVARAVRELRGGRVEFRADRGAQLHLPLGKLGAMADAELAANAGALAAAVLAAKPEAVKGGLTRLLSKVDLATTFGRGSVGVDVSSVLEAAGGVRRGGVGRD